MQFLQESVIAVGNSSLVTLLRGIVVEGCIWFGLWTTVSLVTYYCEVREGKVNCLKGTFVVFSAIDVAGEGMGLRIEEEGEEEDLEAAATDLVAKLDCREREEKHATVKELRLMSRGDERCRRYIADAGGVEALVALLRTSDCDVQENAITTLLNLSIDPRVRLRITETDSALDAILDLLSSGHTAAGKENAAATLFSLLIVEEYRDEVGQHPLAIPALLSLLRDAPTHRGRKDAIKGLFHLALHDANKPRLVMEGAVQLLVSTMLPRRSGLVDESLSVLAILALCEEGAIAIVAASALPTLVEILAVGPPKSRENALAVLLALCQGGDDIVFHRVAFYNHQIVSSLCSLLVIGSDRAKRKANELMRMLVVSDSSSDSVSSRSYQSGSSFWNDSDPRTQV